MSADVLDNRPPAMAFGARLAATVLALALGACVSDGLDATNRHQRDFFALANAPEGEPLRVPIFVASTRRGDGGPEIDGHAHLSLVSIAVPPGHRTGAIEHSSFGANDARQSFVVIARRSLDDAGFSGEIAAHVSGRVGANRDVLLFIHGYNTSLDEARFRLAQIVADGGFSGVSALFTWDSNGRSGLFDYEADKESATVARDALEKLILDLSHVPGVGRIHILAHSMGSWLTMESLRTIAISGHPDLDGKLGEVMLAAPDIDLAVFRQQASRVGPRHVSIFIAGNDRVLRISSHIAGDRPRLGAMDPSNPRDKEELDELGVSVHDLSRLNTDFKAHDTFAESPAVVQQIGAQLAVPPPGEADTQAVIDVSGGSAGPANAAGPSGEAVKTASSGL